MAVMALIASHVCHLPESFHNGHYQSINSRYSGPVQRQPRGFWIGWLGSEVGEQTITLRDPPDHSRVLRVPVRAIKKKSFSHPGLVPCPE